MKRPHFIAARKGLELTQAELARLAGVAPNTISRTEAALHTPRADALVRLCQVLGLDIARALETDAPARHPLGHLLRPTTPPPRPVCMCVCPQVTP